MLRKTDKVKLIYFYMMSLETKPADIYTDGSCHTQTCFGGWASLLFIEGEKITLSGKEANTTHNRMELTAVIKAIEYVRNNFKSVMVINIFSDSQYITGLTSREEKLSALDFKTKKGNEIRNADLLKELLQHTKSITINFIKIKAHQKKNDEPNYNMEADKLSRKIVRQAVD